MTRRKDRPAAEEPLSPGLAAEEAKTEQKRHGFFVNLLCGLGLLVLCAAVGLGAVMLHSWTEPGAEKALNAEDFEVEGGQRERVVAGESSDLTYLRTRAGYPLPYFDGQMFMGEIRNAAYDGKNVCLVTMTYRSGLVITAAAPREAAPLLLREGMEVLTGRTWEISLAGNVKMPGLMCRGNSGACLYFETDGAAYSVFAPGMGAEELYGYLSETSLNVK